jgi:hypothetical protein
MIALRNMYGTKWVPSYQLLHFLYSVLSFLGVLDMIYLSFDLTKKYSLSKQLYEKLEAKIARSRDVTRWIAALGMIAKAEKFRYKAWDFFVIDKQIILSFCCSLVSYTIMFSQLAQTFIVPVKEKA